MLRRRKSRASVGKRGFFDVGKRDRGEEIKFRRFVCKISIKICYAPHSSPYGDTFPPGGRLKTLSKVAFSDSFPPRGSREVAENFMQARGRLIILSKVAFGDGRLPKQP